MAQEVTAEAFARLPADRSAVLAAGRLHHRPPPSPDVAQRGRRVARLLLPTAAAAGGFTSTRLVVRTRRCPDDAVRPAVSAVLGPPPADGVLDKAPDLVVLLGEADDDPAAWLRLGCSEVWVVTARGAAVVTAAGRVLHAPRGALTHAALPLHLPLDEACSAGVAAQAGGPQRVAPHAAAPGAVVPPAGPRSGVG